MDSSDLKPNFPEAATESVTSSNTNGNSTIRLVKDDKVLETSASSQNNNSETSAELFDTENPINDKKESTEVATETPKANEASAQAPPAYNSLDLPLQQDLHLQADNKKKIVSDAEKPINLSLDSNPSSNPVLSVQESATDTTDSPDNATKNNLEAPVVQKKESKSFIKKEDKEIDLQYFETKSIDWIDANNNKKKVNILLQNFNGPCPLVALVNVLVLTRPEVAEYTSNKQRISVSGLLEYLGSIIVADDSDSSSPNVDVKGKGKSKGNNNRSTLEASMERFNIASPNPALKTKDIDQVFTLLPKLVTGMNIDPCFDGTFSDVPEMSLFRIYNVGIVHGWIADPKASYYENVWEATSYENSQIFLIEANEKLNNLDSNPKEEPLERTLDPRAQETKTANSGSKESEEDIQKTIEKMNDITMFLESYPSQLTEYGIEFLTNIMVPGTVAVLFRNDHFSTIYKPLHPLEGYENSDPNEIPLLTLVTDAGLGQRKNLVWETLNSISGITDVFYTGTFKIFKDYDEEEFKKLQKSNNTSQNNAAAASTSAGDPSLYATVDFDHKDVDNDFELAQRLQQEENSRNGALIDEVSGSPIPSSEQGLSDFEIAKMLQAEEDHRIASNLDKHQKRQTRHSNTSSQRKKQEQESSSQKKSSSSQSKSGSQNKSKNGKKDCIIM